MGKIVETYIKDFTTGWVHDDRHPDSAAATAVKNFDILTFPHRLVPYRSSEAGNANQDTEKISHFLFAVGKLYGLGADTASGDLQIYERSAYTDDTWSECSNGQGASAFSITNTELFIYYPYGGTDYLFGAYGGATDQIWRWNMSGGAAFVDAHYSLAHSYIGQGLVHSKDDILYIPYTDTSGIPKIAKSNAGAWTPEAIILPSGGYISAICEYGNFLAIAWSPNSIFNTTAKVYLWDRDSSLTTTSEKIDWGYGELKVLEELEGELIGIQQISSTDIFNSQLTVKRYAGVSGTQEIAKLVGSTATCTLTTRKQKRDRRLYFMSTITVDGTKYQGVWSIGRSETGRFCLSLDRTPNDDTALSGETLWGFYIVGSYMFISYQDGSGYAMRKTLDTAGYSATSLWQSIINPRNESSDNDSDASISKKLIGVTITTDPLPSGASVTVKYRINSESSYTTIFTYSTENGLDHSAINIESTGANLPEYKEIQFQLLSTGGAEITGFSYAREILDKRLY